MILHAHPRSVWEFASKFRFYQTRVLADQLFDLGELIVELQTLFVRQCVRRLDDLTRHDLLNGKFDFLEVDRRLWH